jgi:2-C-methyl-D-erythritol 4-phosphate cytidylyltransferase
MAAHSQSTVAAILVAGGSGERLGAGRPKAFVEVAGATLLEHAVARFAGHPAIRRCVVVAPAGRVDEAARLTGVPAVAGGADRRASVAAGLAALDEDVEFVLVHDVARPFVPVGVLDAVIAALHGGADAAVPVVAIHDTVRRVDPSGALAGVVDRAGLVAVQTPQGFRRPLLVAAHAHPGGASATDDAALLEALGHEVVAVPGDELAFKVTTPLDLARAETVARLVSAESAVRPTPGGTP